MVSPEWKHIKQDSGKSQLPIKGLSILDERGNLSSETLMVLQLVKEANIAIATSHISKEETKLLVEEANRIGLKKIIITHVTQSDLWHWSIDEQKALVRQGAIIEHSGVFSMENNFMTPQESLPE